MKRRECGLCRAVAPRRKTHWWELGMGGLAMWRCVNRAACEARRDKHYWTSCRVERNKRGRSNWHGRVCDERREYNASNWRRQ